MRVLLPRKRGLPAGWSVGLSKRQIDDVLRRERLGPRIQDSEHPSGYRRVWLGKSHPYAQKSGQQWIHRYVMMAVLGRRLDSWEHVHHKNGNKAAISPDAFRVLHAIDHMSLHYGINFIRSGGYLHWKSCGREFTEEELQQKIQALA